MMMKDTLKVGFETETFPSGAIEIVQIMGREAISNLFELNLLVTARKSTEIDADKLIGQPATLVFVRNGIEIRRLFGMVSLVQSCFEPESDHDFFRVFFVPRAYRLALVETLDVFLDISVPDIVRKKLHTLAFEEGKDFEMRLQDHYPAREFIVQYKETDLQFISRLAEHIGISFFFEHSTDRDVMVFSDANAGFRPIQGDAILPLRSDGSLTDVYRIEEKVRMIPGQYIVQDYNYRTPHVTLTGKAEVPAGTGTIIEYGTHIKTPEEAERMAQLRAQEHLASRRVFDGTSAVERLRAGGTFTLENHPRGDLELLVTEVIHELKSPKFASGAAEGPVYKNEFRAILASRRFRPARITPKPRIHGVVNGIIDAEDKGNYAELDSEGRYRVRFLFDTTNPGEGQASRLVRMAQPHAGPGYGMHFPLRPGVEVIITFVDGDPDRPIIAATVPNPQTASPVGSGNAPRNIIRTGSGNEINIDDTRDGQRIKLSTPHKNTVFQLGSPNSPEEGAMLETQGASSSIALSGVAGFTSITSTVSAVGEFFSSGNISRVAEKPKCAALTGTVGEILSGWIEVASAGVEMAYAEHERHVAELKLESLEYQKEVKEKHARAVERRKTVGEKGAALKGKLPSDIQEKIDAYEAAQATYESDMRDLMSNQEFLRDAYKGQAAGTYLGEIDYYEVTVADCKKALYNANPDADPADEAHLHGSKVWLEMKREELRQALAALPDGDPAKADAMAYADALEDAGKSEEEVQEEWNQWNDPGNPMREYDNAAAEAEYGHEALELKEAKLRIAEMKVATRVLFSVVMQLVAAVEWLVQRIRSKTTWAQYLRKRWQSKGRLIKSHIPIAYGGLVRHTIGSTGSTKVYGEKLLRLKGKTVTLEATDAEIVGEDCLHLISVKEIEIAAANKVAITSAVVDAAVNTFKSVSNDNTTFVSSSGNISLQSCKQDIELTADTKAIGLYAKTTLEGTAKQIELTARKTANLLAGSWGLKVNGETGAVKLGSNDWSLTIQTANVTLGSNTTNLKVNRSGIQSSVGANSKVALTNQSLSAKTGSITLNGTQNVEIKANGRVLLA